LFYMRFTAPIFSMIFLWCERGRKMKCLVEDFCEVFSIYFLLSSKLTSNTAAVHSTENAESAAGDSFCMLTRERAVKRFLAFNSIIFLTLTMMTLCKCALTACCWCTTRDCVVKQQCNWIMHKFSHLSFALS
jgi:hypothetical protein